MQESTPTICLKRILVAVHCFGQEIVLIQQPKIESGKNHADKHPIENH
jgi:hypothetical protein